MLQWILLVCCPELRQWHGAPNTQLPYALAANCSKLTIFQKRALLRKEANEPRSLCTVPSLDRAAANDWHRKITFAQGRANSVMSFVVHGSQWDKADISLLLRTCLCLAFSPAPSSSLSLLSLRSLSLSTNYLHSKLCLQLCFSKLRPKTHKG